MQVSIRSELRDALSAWDVGRVVGWRLVKRGEVNRNFIVRTSHGKYVLRQVSHIHHKSAGDLEFELAYLDHLRAAGFAYSVPSAISTKKGSPFVTVHGHYYWLYKFLEGRVIERLNGARLAQLAEMMATYHALVERSALNNGRPVSDVYNRTATLKEIEENRNEILQKHKTHQNESTFLEESAKLTRILRGLNERPYSGLELYPIHRDLIPENLIWKQDKLSAVIDFEHVSESNDPIVKDIAVTVQHCCRERQSRFELDLDSAGQFFRSYVKHRSLSDEEIRLIPDVITMGWIEDFAYAFWMLRNDPKRANASALLVSSKAAQWSNFNREKIFRAFLN